LVKERGKRRKGEEEKGGRGEREKEGKDFSSFDEGDQENVLS
jgi:hypothetical protein